MPSVPRTARSTTAIPIAHAARGVAAALVAGNAPRTARDLLTNRIRRSQNLYGWPRWRGFPALRKRLGVRFSTAIPRRGFGAARRGSCPWPDGLPVTMRPHRMLCRTAGSSCWRSSTSIEARLRRAVGSAPSCVTRPATGRRGRTGRRSSHRSNALRDALSPDEALQQRQLLRMLLEAIDQLPPTYREVVLLRDVDERPVAEVARELHISRSNVAVRLHRAHNRLRRRLVQSLQAPKTQPPSGASP